MIMFDTSGKKLHQWGDDSKLFNAPVSVSLDSKDNIFVTDHANNRVLVFKPILLDTEPPRIINPTKRDFEVSDTLPKMIVPYTITAVDNVDGQITPICNPPPESFFPIGSTTVICTASDKAGNKAESSFVINVIQILTDTEPPIITTPEDITKTITEDIDEIQITYTVTAIDDVDGQITPICNPPPESFFPIGSTTVICTASDKAGNKVESSFLVTLRYQDTDSDLIPDFEDNCPQVKNNDQRDDDFDGIGNVCDLNTVLENSESSDEFPLELLIIPAIIGGGLAGYKVLKSKGSASNKPTSDESTEPDESRDEKNKEPNIEIEVEVGFEN